MDVTDTGERRSVEAKVEWATCGRGQLHLAGTLLLGDCSFEEARSYVGGSDGVLREIHGSMAAYSGKQGTRLVVRSMDITTAEGMQEVLDRIAGVLGFELTVTAGGENKDILDEERRERMVYDSMPVVVVVSPRFPLNFF